MIHMNSYLYVLTCLGFSLVNYSNKYFSETFSIEYGFPWHIHKLKHYTVNVYIKILHNHINKYSHHFCRSVKI